MGADGASGEAVTIHVRCSNGAKFSVQVPLDSTVGFFKGVVAEKSDVPAEQQRLIYKGRILKDEQTLASYGLEADHTVHLVRGFLPSGTTPAATNANAAQSSPAATPAPSPAPPAEAPRLGASLFPGLGGGPIPAGLFGTGLPEFDQVQQQLTQNPNMMREIMNLPAIQNLMNNPDLMRNLIMANPQMREIIDRNPDLAHILNDPSTLRQTLEAARNPELMREMMRNTDRAMSNIESSPEGFNMLRRMYETVQEPFLNATTMGADGGGAAASANPLAALLGAQNRDRSAAATATAARPTEPPPVPNTNPLPNPWGAPGGGGTTGTARPQRSPPPAAAAAAAPAAAAGEARIPGLGGLGFPDMEQMMGGMQDPAALSQMLQNPAVSQIMQSLLSNPQYMNQILGLNPQMRSLLESNSQLREMLQNPDFLRQLTSPETMQQLLALQQSLSSFGRQQPGPGENQTGAGAGGMDLLMNMFGGLGAGGFGVPPAPNVPPEQLYATQLSQLQEMGFFDTQENIRALTATAGNVHAAVERLLGNPGQ
ncbi:ubiquitin domain-containing protein DSK2a-like [Wolffia australiana]